MRVYGNLIAFGLQWLFVVEKWETIVDTVTRFNKIASVFPNFTHDSNKFLRIYLLEFSLHAQEKLYQMANAKSKDKRDEIKLREQQYNIGMFTLQLYSYRKGE